MNIELSAGELELLRDVLADRMSGLRQQVYHAEAPAFKDGLKLQKSTLQGLISKLPS